MEDQFEDDLKEMNETGAIYRLVADRFGDEVDLVYTDPRNMISIFTYMIRQVWHRRINIFLLLKNITWGARRGAIFLNGRWVNEQSFSPEELVWKIQQQLR